MLLQRQETGPVDIFIKPFNCGAQNREQLSSTGAIDRRRLQSTEERPITTYKSRWMEGDSIGKGLQVNWTPEDGRSETWPLGNCALIVHVAGFVE